MKEATGEVSMTVVTLAAIAIIGAILAVFWQPITNKIGGLFNNSDQYVTKPDVKFGDQ